jgi:transposase
MVLKVEEGRSLYAIEREGGPKKNTVRKWVERFYERRQKEPGRPIKEYLADAERAGRPPEFTAEQCVQLMSLATTDPATQGVPHSHWSCRELSRVAVRTGGFSHLSKSHVQRLLKQDALQPHRVRMWLNRKDDADYEARAEAVNQVVREATEAASDKTAPLCEPAPPGQRELEHAVVSFDEKPGIQALERAAPDRPMRAGRPALLEHSYHRHGTLCLLSMMQVNTGCINGFCLPQRTNEDTAMTVRVLLGMLLMQGYKRVTAIMDQLNTHMSLQMVQSVAVLCDLPMPDEKELDTRHKRRAWLEDPTHRIRFLFTPRHASWLNPIEKWFSVLVRRLLRRASFRSLSELSARIGEFIDYYNRHLAHPYRFRRRKHSAAKQNPCATAQGLRT